MSEKSNYKLVSTLAASFFFYLIFILAGKKDNYIVSNEFEIRTAELAALDQFKKNLLLENYSKYFDDLLAPM